LGKSRNEALLQVAGCTKRKMINPLAFIDQLFEIPVIAMGFRQTNP